MLCLYLYACLFVCVLVYVCIYDTYVLCVCMQFKHLCMYILMPSDESLERRLHNVQLNKQRLRHLCLEANAKLL
jgi:hypothetical protein